MDSSKIFGDHGAEECQSSESGWTMYIGSPIDDDDEDEDGHVNDEDGHHVMKKKVYVDDEYEYDGSDDSMASDASSGPSHLHQQQQQQPWEGSEGGHGPQGQDQGTGHKYHKDDKVKKNVRKKKKNSNNKTGFEARNEQKEESLVDEKRGIVTVQSGNWARYIGLRK